MNGVAEEVTEVSIEARVLDSGHLCRPGVVLGLDYGEERSVARGATAQAVTVRRNQRPAAVRDRHSIPPFRQRQYTELEHVAVRGDFEEAAEVDGSIAAVAVLREAVLPEVVAEEERWRIPSRMAGRYELSQAGLCGEGCRSQKGLGGRADGMHEEVVVFAEDHLVDVALQAQVFQISGRGVAGQRQDPAALGIEQGHGRPQRPPARALAEEARQAAGEEIL